MNSQDAANTQQPDVRRVSRREFGWSTVAATLGVPAWRLVGPSPRKPRKPQRRVVATLRSAAVAAVTGKPIRIGSNENPHGLGPAALAAVTAVCPEANRYPGASISELTARLAEIHSVSRDRILLLAGLRRNPARGDAAPSPALAKSLVEASPTFENPGRTAKMSGAHCRRHSGHRWRFDGPARDGGQGGRLRHVLHSATGTTRRRGSNSSPRSTQFVAAVRKVSPDALIPIDEAYFEYVEDPSYATAIPITAKDPRVIVSRTFSKIHGMAGLRVGYAIGNPDALGAMRAYMSQGSISGLERLDGPRLAERHREHGQAGRDEQGGARLHGEGVQRRRVQGAADASELRDGGREARFQLVPGAVPRAGRDDRALVPAAATHARVSVGTMDEMKRAMAVMLPLLAVDACLGARRAPPSWGQPESIAAGVMVDESDLLFAC